MIVRAALAALIAGLAIACSAEPLNLPALTLDAWRLHHPFASVFGPETFSAAGAPTGAAGWLGALIAGSLFAAGPGAVHAFNGLCAALALALLARQCSRVARGGITVAAVALAGISSIGGWGTGTLGLELLATLAFTAALRSDRIPRIYLAIAVAIVWCNLSVSGLIAPLLALAATAGAAIDERRATPRLRALAVVTAASVFATACTPGGVDFASNALTHLGLFEASVEAFTPWDPAIARPAALLLGFIPLIVLCAWSGLRNAAGATSVALGLCAIVLGLAQAPLLPLAAFAIAPLFAQAAERVFGAALDAIDLRRSGLVIGACAAMAVAVAATAALRADRHDNGARDAVAAARAAGAQRLFCANPAWCNFAIASGGAQVFLDGRVTSYPAGRRTDAMKVNKSEKNWQDVLERWKVDAVVTERSRPLTALLELDPRWRQLSRSGDVAVFVRGA